MSAAYARQCEFVDRKMRMVHIYPPVMLQVPSHGGRASIRRIAQALLGHDESTSEGTDALGSSTFALARFGGQPSLGWLARQPKLTPGTSVSEGWCGRKGSFPLARVRGLAPRD